MAISSLDAVRNGVDTQQLFSTLDAVKAQPELGRFQFRARNRWIDGARGVTLASVESTLEGDMDVRGALGLSESVRNGFSDIRVTFHVTSDAPRERVEEVVRRATARSAVYDMITNGVVVDVALA